MKLIPKAIAAVALLARVTHSRIETYAALGDSYAAGDGAGSSRWLPHLDPICGRFSEAYPIQIAHNSTLRIHYFRNVAYGGATTQSIVHRQIRYLDGADLATIQVGGNEVDFFPVLNECIQQWKPWSTCDREISRARSLIQSTKFVEAFGDMVKYAVSKVDIRRQILILGYPRFFNAETEQCNQVSFSKTNPANVLSNKLRASCNDLISMLNDVIEASARAHGATYIDIDALFEGHRFCEDGVEEPHPDWDGTWFFREAPETAGEEQFFQSDPHADTLGSNQLRLSIPLKDFADLTRTFHPTLQGHRAIARYISTVITMLDG